MFVSFFLTQKETIHTHIWFHICSHHTHTELFSHSYTHTLVSFIHHTHTLSLSTHTHAHTHTHAPKAENQGNGLDSALHSPRCVPRKLEHINLGNSPASNELRPSHCERSTNLAAVCVAEVGCIMRMPSLYIIFTGLFISRRCHLCVSTCGPWLTRGKDQLATAVRTTKSANLLRKTRKCLGSVSHSPRCLGFACWCWGTFRWSRSCNAICGLLNSALYSLAFVWPFTPQGYAVPPWAAWRLLFRLASSEMQEKVKAKSVEKEVKTQDRNTRPKKAHTQTFQACCQSVYLQNKDLVFWHRSHLPRTHTLGAEMDKGNSLIKIECFFRIFQKQFWRRRKGQQ